MTYEIYRYIFIGGAILSGIMLMVSIILFIELRIPNVIGYLTGSNARKEIACIQNKSTNYEEKSYRSSAVKRGRGKVTDKISRISLNGSNAATHVGTTDKLANMNSRGTDVLPGTNASSPVVGSTILQEAYTNNETTILETQTPDKVFAIEFEITYTHSDEIII